MDISQYNSLAELFKELRKEKRLNVNNFAKIFNYNKDGVSRIESGKQLSMAMSVTERFCSAFDISKTELTDLIRRSADNSTSKEGEVIINAWLGVDDFIDYLNSLKNLGIKSIEREVDGVLIKINF